MSAFWQGFLVGAFSSPLAMVLLVGVLSWLLHPDRWR